MGLIGLMGLRGNGWAMMDNGWAIMGLRGIRCIVGGEEKGEKKNKKGALLGKGKIILYLCRDTR